jgi:hypothetical protein
MISEAAQRMAAGFGHDRPEEGNPMNRRKTDPPAQTRRGQSRSPSQREWNAAVGLAATLWEGLTDDERLTWNVAGANHRMSGYNYFVKINAPRLRDRKEPTRLPPPQALPADNPVRQLLITNTGGRVKLWLQVRRPPTVPITVWASRPCKLGIGDCHKCPRLGMLPPPKRGLCEITRLYFAKHGEYITTHRVPLAGKRIFVRTRLELDGAPSLFRPVSAIVPRPGEQSWEAKAGPFL